MARFCSKCGSPLHDNARFCPNCGRALATDSEMQSNFVSKQPVSMKGSEPGRSQYSDPSDSKQSFDWQKPKSSQRRRPTAPLRCRRRRRSGLVIALICVLVAGLIVVLGFLWPGFFRQDGSVTAEITSTNFSMTSAPETTQSTTAPTKDPPVESVPVTEPKPTTPEETSKPAATQPSTISNPFSDVEEGDPCYAEYLWAYTHGVITGNQLAADTVLTRATFITMLWTAFGSPAVEQSDASIRDVNASDACYSAVLWAKAKKLVSFPDDGCFRPNEEMTRDQASLILCLAADGDSTEQPQAYLDVSSKKYFFHAVNWGYAAGIFERGNDFRFRPADPLLRGEFACWLARTQEPTLALKPFLPAGDHFEDYGIEINLKKHGVAYFNARPKTGEANSQHLKVTVQSYEIFEKAEDYDPREGYEWRKGVFVIDYGEADADAYTYSLYVDINNMDYVELFESNRQINSDNSESSWVIYQGIPCKVYMNPLIAEKLDHALYRVTYAVEVPIGYDGLVVRFNSAENEPDSGEYFYKKYSSPADYVFFRFE